jgi:glycogen debranching enzyme
VEHVVTAQDQFTILATQARADERTRVLKHGETFAVFDRFGDVPSSAAGEYGLYHEGTRYLSSCELRIGGQHPMLLSSTIRKARPLFTADLTTPDVTNADGTLALPKGALHVFRTKFLWDGACYERLQVSNYDKAFLRAVITMSADADFADIFEVRGTARARHGRRMPDEVRDGALHMAYIGLDEVRRETTIVCDPAPSSIHRRTIALAVNLAPGETAAFDLTITCERTASPRPHARYVDALEASSRNQAMLRGQQCRVHTSNDEFNEWLNRSAADLTMMMTERREGLYPYAGVPWFSAPFGRDGIITALQFLWMDPTLASGVLRYLAATQATTHAEDRDAQPGKILHEAREGEMAAVGEVPFARYYGSVDSTPLFVMLAGAYYERTGDLELIRTLWPHIDQALVWLDQYGDADQDGLVEYERRSANGLVNQGWKDSHDAISHADGAMPEGPIALCEVQGYTYAARIAGARLAGALERRVREVALVTQAKATQRAFEERFWQPDLGTYALALDGRKRPCRVRASNAGHCLYTGIADQERAERVAQTLMGEGMYSGWGVRTLAAGEARYNPMAYHNGSVWPHDNALIAAGFTRYGLKDLAAKIFSDAFDAAGFLELRRVPELFCGFERRPGEGPTLYPIACLPQAWAATSLFMLLQAVLGLQIDGLRRQVIFGDPVLPQWLTWLRIEDLRVGDAVVDLLCERHPHDVGISVLRREGRIRVVHFT